MLAVYASYCSKSCMSPVSQVFHTVVTVSIDPLSSFKVGIVLYNIRCVVCCCMLNNIIIMFKYKPMSKNLLLFL